MSLKYQVQISLSDEFSQPKWDPYPYRTADLNTLAKARKIFSEALIQHPEQDCRLVTLTKDLLVFEVLSFKKGKKR